MQVQPGPPAPPPETKDWTWVVETPCAECGYDPAAVDVTGDLGPRVLAAAAALGEAAVAPGGRDRPSPLVWSPLEYAAHVRDTCRIGAQRVRLMQDEDGARFPNWDQDAAAVEGRYWEGDPARVRTDLAEAAAEVVRRFASVTPEQWGHRGLRSNGSAFTVDTLARYFLHDLEHHVHDVAPGRAAGGGA